MNYTENKKLFENQFVVTAAFNYGGSSATCSLLGSFRQKNREKRDLIYQVGLVKDTLSRSDLYHRLNRDAVTGGFDIELSPDLYELYKAEEPKLPLIQIKRKSPNQPSTGFNTEVLIDGKPLQGITSLQLDIKARGLASLKLEVLGRIEAEAQVADCEINYEY